MPPTTTIMNMQPHFDQINGEVLKGAGIDPPPYTPAVMNRAALEPEPPLYEVSSLETQRYSFSDDDSLNNIANQSRSSSDSLPQIPDGVYRTKKELKAAYKAVRRNEKAMYKAEKAAVKAERRNSKILRKGGCC